jgi:hypothetical protein
LSTITTRVRPHEAKTHPDLPRPVRAVGAPDHAEWLCTGNSRRIGHTKTRLDREPWSEPRARDWIIEVGQVSFGSLDQVLARR